MIINQTIGSYYDQVRNRTFSFVWNSDGYHGIYVQDMVTEVISPLIVVGASTVGDVLGFNLQVPIIGIDIIYGDDANGDELWYLDSLRRPSKLNIGRALSGGYGIVKRRMLDVAKAPAAMPPKAVYENDNNVTANNLKNSLFQFAYVLEDWDKARSVFSAYSDVPLPNQPFNQTVDADVKKNARIAIYVQTGGSDVRKIIVMVRQNQGDVTSEWRKVITLDKDALAIPNNSIYRYVFYNDGVYPDVDAKWAASIQDYVPDFAYSQEMLNGVIPAYGGIIEGMNPVATDMSAAATSTLLPYNVYNGVLFFAYQNDDHTISIYLTGTGTNDGSNNAQTLTNAIGIYTVGVSDATNADKSFSYTNTTANPTIATILNQLKNAASLAGYAFVSQTSNSLVLSYYVPLRLQSSFLTRTTGAVLPTTEAEYALVPEASYTWGIAYFNSKGKTGGVFTSVSFTTNTPALTNNINSDIKLPLVTLTIRHRPPIDATYFHIVRTDQQTYGKRFNWVSSAAYSNYTVITGVPQTFAYIGIDNINTFNLANPTANNPVGYEFQAGDRIRFSARYASDNTKTNLFGKDYVVLGIETNPVVNGVAKTGTFVKINYPTADISADFKFDGSDNFQNYQILLYSLAQHASTEDAVYYEIGREYGIGNAGTNTAFHFGDIAQSADLTQPAVVYVSEGEQFFRYRNVPVGIKYDIPTEPFQFGSIYATFSTSLITPISTSTYKINNQTNTTAGITSSDYPNYSSSAALFQNISSGVETLEISGDVQVWANGQSNFAVIAKIISPSNTVSLVRILDSAVLQNEETKSFHFDGAVQVPAGYKVFGLLQNSSDTDYLHITITNLQYNVIRNVSIPIVEDTFSDTVGIRMTSDGRPNVVQPDEKQEYKEEWIRFGLARQGDTDINETNRFYDENYVTVDRSRGGIRRLFVEERLLYIYQQRGVCQMGIYSRFIKDNSGGNILTATEDILTRNNVQYLLGDFGCNDYPEGIVRSKNAHFFPDVLRGYIVARYNNGLEPISELRYGQYYIRDLITPYNVPRVTANGGKAMIIGTYDYKEENYIAVLQGYELPVSNSTLIITPSTTINTYVLAFSGTPVAGQVIRATVNVAGANVQTLSYTVQDGDTIQSIALNYTSAINGIYTTTGYTAINTTTSVAIQPFPLVNGIAGTFVIKQAVQGYTLRYNQKRGGFVDFMNLYPEWIGNAEEKVLSWLNGNVYIHDNHVRNTFFGVAYDSSITVVFKLAEGQQKTFESIEQISNTIWDCPDIETQLESYGITKQKSKLAAGHFRKLGGKYSATFKRDINSIGCIINGNTLKGNYIKIKFRLQQPTNFVFLSLVTVYFIDSPRNLR